MKRRHLVTTTFSKQNFKKELCIHRRLLEWGHLLIKNTFEGGRLFVKGRCVKSNYCGVSLELQSLNSTFNRAEENKFSSAPLWSVIFFFNLLHCKCSNTVMSHSISNSVILLRSVLFVCQFLGWPYSSGFINDVMLKEHMPPPGPDTQILMCGPPPMINYACVPNLEKLGYTPDMYFPF